MSSFSQIIKSRSKVKKELIGDKTMLKDAVSQLVSYHQDVEAILSEAGSIGVSTVSVGEQVGSQVSKNGPEILKHCVMDNIGKSSVLHTAETCANQLLEYVRNIRENQSETKTSSMVSLECHIKLVKELMKGKYFNRPRFLNILCNELCLPVSVLCVLHEESVMLLESYMRFKQTDSKFISGFSDEVLAHIESKASRKMFNEVMGVLIKLSFPEKGDTDHSMKKICTSILMQTLHKYLASKRADTVFDTLVPDHHVLISELSMKKFCSFLLNQIFIFQPTLNVVESFHQQKNWTFLKLPLQLIELYKQILLVLDTPDILEILKQTLDTQEVNWYYYTAFWSTYIICTNNSRTVSEEFLMDLMKFGFEESDANLIKKGFLIGRQCCQEGSHVFQSYQDWFQYMFGDNVKSLANSKKTFTCLMKVLTDLVPYDDHSYLKVHILRPPFVPPKCKELLTEYIILAKTRLVDLKEPLEQVTMYEGTSGSSSTKFQNQVEEEIQKALAAFQTNNKMPSAVMEASIFRKSYFIGKFIPVLLKPRTLPSIPDVRMKFIEALKKIEKIPPNIYKTYEIDCKKEAENLLKGVFMDIDDEDDDDLEMTMSAIEQFNYRLSQLMDKIVQKQSTKRFSEMISIIREKICVLLDKPDLSTAVKNTLEIDMKNPQLKLNHVKIIDGILNLFCKVSEVCLSMDQLDLSWASQIVDVLTEFRTLHKTLFVRIFKLVIDQANNLECHHITGLALLLTFLSVKSSNFGLVELSPCIRSCCQGQQYFPEKLWNLLPINTGEQMMIGLKLMSLYLFCVFSVIDNSCLLEEDYNRIYPMILMKKFTFLCQRMMAGHQLGFTEQGTSANLLTAFHIYKSDQFKEMLKTLQITFEDWINMELVINPDKDLLSYFERQEYLHDFVYKYYLTKQKQDGGCNHDYRYVCSVMVEAIVEADTKSSCSSTLYCPMCLQNRRNTNSKVFIMQYLQELCWLLPTSKTSSQNHKPWLISTLKLLSRKYSDSLSHQAVVKLFFRIISCLPRWLFYTDNIKHPDVDINLVESVINGELKDSLGHGCIFQRSVFLYLIQGMLQIQDTIDVDRILINCPVLLTSLLVYLPQCNNLIQQLIIRNKELNYIIEWLNRPSEDTLPEFGDGPSWMYSAILLSLFVKRNSVDNIITVLPSQRGGKLDLIVGEFIIMYTSHMADQSEDVQYKNVLDKLHAYNPKVLQFLPDHSHYHHLCSKSTIPMIPYKLLRYISSKPQNKMLLDTAYMNTVLHLYSQVVNLFDDQNTNDKPHLHSGLELFTFVKTCITRVPDFVLKSLNQELLIKCGMDVVLTVDEKLKR